MNYTTEQQIAGNMIESAISYLIWMGDNDEAHEWLRQHSFNLRYSLSDAWEYSEKWGEIYQMLRKAKQEGKEETRERFQARLLSLSSY